jgi:hypothetical protein
LHGRVEIDVEALVLDELYGEGVALVAPIKRSAELLLELLSVSMWVARWRAGTATASLAAAAQRDSLWQQQVVGHRLPGPVAHITDRALQVLVVDRIATR